MAPLPAANCLTNVCIEVCPVAANCALTMVAAKAAPME